MTSTQTQTQAGAAGQANGGAPEGTQTLLVSDCCPASMRKRAFWSVDQFHIIKKLGSGYASTVYLGTCRATGTQIGLKMYHKQKLSELNYSQISREIRIHSALDHQNIVQLWAAFEDVHGVYLITEYASKGDVFSDVEKRGGCLTETEAVRQIIYPFLCALQYLHGNNIVHRDIKPENLLLNAMGVLKVADFGLSINLAEERPVTRVGTLDYMSPEVVICPDKSKPQENKELKHLYYTPLVDAWAVGVLAYELIVGKPPFDRGNKKATVQEILHGEPIIPSSVSDEACAFIRWSLCKDQRRRPDVSELMEHPWIADNMAISSLHMRGLKRADSCAAPHALGVDSMEDIVHNAQTQALQHTGRMLQSSVSMSAIDTMRFRDVRVELGRLEAAAAKSRANSGSGAQPAPSSFDNKPFTQSSSERRKTGDCSPQRHGSPAPGPNRVRVPVVAEEGSATSTPSSLYGHIRKSVVVVAADPMPESPIRSRSAANLRKQVSFSAKSAHAPTMPPPTTTHKERSSLTHSRTFTEPETSRSRSASAFATTSTLPQSSSHPHAAPSQQVLASGSRGLPKALSHTVSKGNVTISLDDLRTSLQTTRGPSSPSRPLTTALSGGAPLVPSKPGPLPVAGANQCSVPASKAVNAPHLYSSSAQLNLFSSSQRPATVGDSIQHFRNLGSLTGIAKGMPLAQEDIHHEWTNASKSDKPVIKALVGKVNGTVKG